MSSSKHVAILDEELPYPPTSGKRIRTWELTRRLAARHRLTWICHRNADADEYATAAHAFREIGVRVVCTGQPLPAKSGLGFPLRLAGNLLSSLPYSVASHARPELARLVAQVRDGSDPVDLWHCEWTPYAQLLRQQPPARWLIVAHNVESVIWQRLAEAEARPFARWYLQRQWQKFQAFERWAYQAAPLTVAVSPEDAERIRYDFGGGRIEVVSNGVDVAGFRPPAGQQRDRYRVLFLGSLDWRPNLDGLRVLLETIWPQVRVKEPKARLVIVGRKPPGWLHDFAQRLPDIELHADVPDVRPFVHTSGLLAVPLRVGGGSRLKILEALAGGLPVVSTTVGAEGLSLVPDQHLTTADEPEAFAQALLAAFRSPERMRSQVAAGSAYVAERYDWTQLAEQLNTVWHDVACGVWAAHAARAAAA